MHYYFDSVIVRASSQRYFLNNFRVPDIFVDGKIWKKVFYEWDHRGNHYSGNTILDNEASMKWMLYVWRDDRLSLFAKRPNKIPNVTRLLSLDMRIISNVNAPMKETKLADGRILTTRFSEQMSEPLWTTRINLLFKALKWCSFYINLEYWILTRNEVDKWILYS